ncbi:MAG: APC family permease [Elusimicrobia bacterium]|nr:APC family permease [Elusimicrobiota bacterium]
MDWFKRLLIGRPLLTHELSHQRLTNWTALAVFASDALSSVAYATDEILLALAKVGPAYLYWVPILSGAVVVLLFIVASSYKQTIQSYPSGGGAYTVAKENLGAWPALMAGAALLVDYVLTVAVSVSAGTEAITSAFPEFYDHRINLALFLIFVITVANLRGIRESAVLFSPPVYAFVGFLGFLIVSGIGKIIATHGGIISSQTLTPMGPTESLSLLLLLMAFSSGCVALTGIEAISNGVMAFKPPESENANKVLGRLVLILGTLLLGVSILSWLYGVIPSEKETLLSQLGGAIFGRGSLYFALQASTAAILVLAANTSFADFPRLASVMARDSFLPRQLQNLGDRLCFSNGILLLAASSMGLVLLFSAKTHFLIPLYSVGVFLSFTLSQAGMVVHHLKSREPFRYRKALLNLVGALTTGLVLLIVLRSKFHHGAWIVCVLIPAMVCWFYAVRRHYSHFDRMLSLPIRSPDPKNLKHTIVIPVSRIHRGVVAALEYAQSLTNNIRAIHVNFDEDLSQKLKEDWFRLAPEISLSILPAPYRDLTEPILEYIRKVEAEDPHDLLTVVIPHFVPMRPWHNVLHNQTAIQLLLALRELKNVVVTTVRTPVE